MNDFNDKMIKIALESGELPTNANSENCLVWTLKEMEEKVESFTDIPEHLFKYINWNDLITDYCNDNAICIVQYNKETDDYETVDSFDRDTNVMFVEYDN
jgi:hypothetical protein